jgi:uncharacterized protein (TIGR04255 family)
MNLTINSEQKRFKNPPIIEAIIAVTIRTLPESSLEALKNLSPQLADLGYSFETPITNHALEFAIENDVSKASSRDEMAGYRFFSTDRRFAFQILRTGLIFSQLGHYESWELFTAEARKIWNIYLSAIAEVGLVQYAVRYINKISIPLGEPLENYIRLHISVPVDLPQEISNPYLRLTFMLSNPDGSLTHQQGMLPLEEQGFATTLLDNEFTFPAADLTPANLWLAIDAVRGTKDNFFFNMLTDKMKEAFDA